MHPKAVLLTSTEAGDGINLAGNVRGLGAVLSLVLLEQGSLLVVHLVPSKAEGTRRGELLYNMYVLAVS